MRCYTISNTVEKTVKTMRFSFLIFVTQFNMIDKSQTVSNPLPLCPKSLAAQPHQSKPAPVDSPFPHPFVLPPCPKSPLAPPPPGTHSSTARGAWCLQHRLPSLPTSCTGYQFASGHSSWLCPSSQPQTWGASKSHSETQRLNHTEIRSHLLDELASREIHAIKTRCIKKARKGAVCESRSRVTLGLCCLSMALAAVC